MRTAKFPCSFRGREPVEEEEGRVFLSLTKILNFIHSFSAHFSSFSIKNLYIELLTHSRVLLLGKQFRNWK